MNSLKRSRKKVDAEIMYEMRRQGMTNKQIAENLGVAVSTVYATIGRLSESVKHAEVQGKPPVVDVPMATKENGFLPFANKEPAFTPPAAQKPPFLPCSARVAEEKAQEKKKPLLTVLSAKYTMQGELCQYTIDTNAGTVEMVEGVSLVSGMLDKTTIRRFILELEQVDEMLKEGKVSA